MAICQEYTIKKGTTNNVIMVRIIDTAGSGATDNTYLDGLTGVVFNASGFTCYYARQDDGDAAGNAVTLATATRGSFTSSGWIEKDATNMPGEYEFGVPNAAVATGSSYCRFVFMGAANMHDTVVHIHLVDNIAQDAVNKWTTALTELSQGVPTATPDAEGVLMALYMAFRNQIVVNKTTGLIEIYNDAGTRIYKKPFTDDGTSYTESEMETGA